MLRLYWNAKYNQSPYQRDGPAYLGQKEQIHKDILLKEDIMLIIYPTRDFD